METLPLASVVPLGADKVAPLILFNVVKFTVRPRTAVPEPFVTVAVRMLFCPDAREDGVAVNVIFNPADVVFAAVLVMTTAPEELKPPLFTLALMIS
jgi:hypothetical protein